MEWCMYAKSLLRNCALFWSVCACSCACAGPYVTPGGCPVFLQKMIDKACTECSQSYCTERAPVSEAKNFLTGYAKQFPPSPCVPWFRTWSFLFNKRVNFIFSLHVANGIAVVQRWKYANVRCQLVHLLIALLLSHFLILIVLHVSNLQLHDIMKRFQCSKCLTHTCALLC